MNINMVFSGPVTVVQASGNITVYVEAGGKVSTASSASTQSKQQWCDSRINPRTLLDNWRKIEEPPPGDWHRSFWGGSPVIFGGTAPAGLNKHDTLFYWKQGQHPAPDGWQILWEDHNTCIIPEMEDDEGGDEYLSTDEDASSSAPAEDSEFDDDVDDDDEDDIL